jgi:hypothetical protein
MRAMNPGVDEKTLKKAVSSRDERAIGQKRARTGGAFQQQLRGTHENYLNRGWGLVLEQHPPFVRTKDGWVPRGHGRCDYAGHVNISPKPVADGYTRRIEPAGSPAPSGRPVPVYFDAKVLGQEHASYRHLQRDQHQLIDLKAALRAGGYAFLLVHAPQVERAFVIGIAEHFDELMRGRGITLWQNRAWSEARDGWLFEPLLPSCEWSAAIGWHWAPQVRFIQRGEGVR